MEWFIENYFKLEHKESSGYDLILKDIFHDELIISNYIKRIQMKLGKLYEILAEKFFGFTIVKKIDLIHTEKRIALELKSSDNTDNSSSRVRNYEKLLEFQKNNKAYKLYYVCINCTNKKPQKKILDNGITFLSGEYALKFLYGDKYLVILSMIQNVLIKQRQHLQIAGISSKTSYTTSHLKICEGTQLNA